MYQVQVNVETEAKAIEVAETLESFLSGIAAQCPGMTPEEVFVIPLD